MSYEDLYTETKYGFKTPDPYGTRRKGTKTTVWRMYQGTNLDIIITGEKEMTPAVCEVRFVLVSPEETYIPNVTYQCNQPPLWEASFGDGVNPGNSPEKVVVVLPNTELTDILSEGSYRYALTRTDLNDGETEMVETGTLQIFYGATSPNPEVNEKPRIITVSGIA